MVAELAAYLTQSGWKVRVVTGFPHHPKGLLYAGYQRALWSKERSSGIDVLRTWHHVSGSRSVLRRSMVLASQALGCAAGALVSSRPDVMVVYGPPLIGPVLGSAVTRMHRAKLVNVVYDLYPDVAVESGKVINPLIIRAASIAERIQYRATDITIVLSEGFKRTLVGRGVPPEKIAVIPVWLDVEEIRPLPRDNAWRHEHGIGIDQLVVLYAGTIGVVSGAEMVAETAKQLRDRTDILLLFVGDGDARANLEKRARAYGLGNMRFLPYQPRERLAEVQATADVSLVTLAPGRGRTSVPSKVMGYMAAGRPVVASVDAGCDTAREVEESGCGVVVPPGDPEALARAITDLLADEHRREQLGRAGRQRVEERYAKPVVLEKYRRVLESLCDRETTRCIRVSSPSGRGTG